MQFSPQQDSLGQQQQEQQPAAAAIAIISINTSTTGNTAVPCFIFIF